MKLTCRGRARRNYMPHERWHARYVTKDAASAIRASLICAHDHWQWYILSAILHWITQLKLSSSVQSFYGYMALSRHDRIVFSSPGSKHKRPNENKTFFPPHLIRTGRCFRAVSLTVCGRESETRIASPQNWHANRNRKKLLFNRCRFLEIIA